MELGVRDWMIIVGVLLILAVLLDGYRRVRNERRHKIKMALNKQFLGSGVEPEALSNSELPGGGPRIIDRSGKTEPSFTEEEMPDEISLGQEAPILMESVEADNYVPVEEPEPESEPEPPREKLQDEFELESIDGSILFEGYEQPEKADGEPRSAETVGQEVITINVMAGKGRVFKGPDLLHILLACDVRYGDMQFFHRYEGANGDGAIQFSVANILNPGTFDLDAIDDFETPGVSFFMCIPGPANPLKAYDFMVETAQCLSKNLEGELLDDTRSAMTKQTLEHNRQRIIENERRRLAQA